MFDWLRRKRMMRRVIEYSRVNPNDEAAAKAIYATVQSVGASSARQVAEMIAGRPLSEEEWQYFGPRWERVWKAIVS